MNNILIVNFLMVIVTLFFMGAFGLLLAWPIKWTWNFIMPYIFGLPTITWGKAWCLNFLSGCLIKGTGILSKE